MPIKPRPYQTRKPAMIRAGLDLVEAHGLGALTFQRVADKAGVVIRPVFTHFKNSAGLRAAIIEAADPDTHPRTFIEGRLSTMTRAQLEAIIKVLTP